ncbi:MAG: hypothetical protein ACKO3N_13840 [Verrucomicrobiota bacterium]
MHPKRILAVALVAAASTGLAACRSGKTAGSADAQPVETSTGLPYRSTGQVDTVPVPRDYRLFPSAPGRAQ